MPTRTKQRVNFSLQSYNAIIPTAPLGRCLISVRVGTFRELATQRGFLLEKKKVPKRLTYSEQQKRNEMWQKGYLWCGRCKQFLHHTSFYHNRGVNQQTNYGYRHYCIECDRNRNDRESQNKKTKVRFRKLKIKAIKLMGGRCQRCGYGGFTSAFDFHHVHPSSKGETPTKILYSKGIEGAWAELDKCCLLCRNCHAGYTGNEWKAEFIKRDGLGWTVGDDLPLTDDRYSQPPEEIRQTTLPLEYKQKPGKQLKLFEEQHGYNAG